MTTTTDTAAKPEERKDFGAWWETSPCAAWCTGDHERGVYNALSDCHHNSHYVRVPARLGKGSEPTVEACIWQVAGDLTPRINIWSEAFGRDEIKLTPAETGLLVEQLNELLHQVYA